MLRNRRGSAWGAPSMTWLRSNIKNGSRVALFALAVQFVMSFGHFHGIAANTAPEVKAGFALITAAFAASDARTQGQKPAPTNHDTDQQPGEACAICAVISLAHNALFATSPLLVLPQASELAVLTSEAEFILLSSIHPAFQSRAPPLS
jgi:hypothetical protein